MNAPSPQEKRFYRSNMRNARTRRARRLAGLSSANNFAECRVLTNTQTIKKNNRTFAKTRRDEYRRTRETQRYEAKAKAKIHSIRQSSRLKEENNRHLRVNNETRKNTKSNNTKTVLSIFPIPISSPFSIGQKASHSTTP